MKENFQDFEEIYNRYLLRLLNLQEDIIRINNFAHPKLEPLIKNIEHLETMPKKKEKLIKKKYKKLNKNLKTPIWFIKSTHSLDQSNVDEYIETTRKNESFSDNEFKRFKLWMKGFTSKEFNPYNILNSYFKIGIIVGFTLFEAFNNEIINLLKDLPIEQQLQGLGFHNVENQLKKELNKLLNFQIEDDFTHWKYLIHFHLIRNLLIHRDGQIDDMYLKKVQELGVEHADFDVGDYLLIEKNTFLDVITLFIIYFEYILKHIKNYRTPP